MRYLRNALILLLLTSLSAFGQQQDIRVDRTRWQVKLNRDLTYQLSYIIEATALTALGGQGLSEIGNDYHPGQQELKIIEAFVLTPEGVRKEVETANIATTQPKLAKEAPGYVNTMTTTVRFPEVEAGGQIYLHLDMEQKQVPALGFSKVFMPTLGAEATKFEVSVTYPDGLELRWGERGGFKITESSAAGEHTVKAVLREPTYQRPESFMPDAADLQPLFVIGSSPNWETFARYYLDAGEESVTVDARVKALSDQIVGEAVDVEAAESVYHWVVRNIVYIPVDLMPADGYGGRTVTEVLQRRFADSRDMVRLTRALLKAQEIEAQPVLVNWGERFSVLPVPAAEQFNHTMLYLPKWESYLNPVDPLTPFGMLDDGLAGKFALLVGQPARTVILPDNSGDNHYYRMENVGRLLENGTVQGITRIEASGTQGVRVRQAVIGTDSLSKLVAELLRSNPLGGFGDLRSADPVDTTSPMRLESKWVAPQAFEMGDSVFVQFPRGADLAKVEGLRRYLAVGPRDTPMVLGTYDQHWLHRLELPEGYNPGKLPTDRVIENSAGSYRSSHGFSDRGVEVERHLSLRKTVLPAAEFEALQALLYVAVNDARTTILLTRDTGDSSP